MRTVTVNQNQFIANNRTTKYNLSALFLFELFNEKKMSKKEKCCVLAVDDSGSVVGFKFYWRYVSKLLREIMCKSYSSYRIVCWSSRFHEVTIEILREHINKLQDDQAGGTEPNLIWEFLDQNKLTNFDLYLMTDGEIDGSRYHRYVELYDALTFKPDAIHVLYCGALMRMNISFLDCFEKSCEIFIDQSTERHTISTIVQS